MLYKFNKILTTHKSFRSSGSFLAQGASHPLWAALDGEIIPLSEPISPTIVSIAIGLLKVTQNRDDLESTGPRPE